MKVEAEERRLRQRLDKRGRKRNVTIDAKYAEHLLRRHEAYQAHLATLSDRPRGGGSTPSGWDHYG